MPLARGPVHQSSINSTAVDWSSYWMEGSHILWSILLKFWHLIKDSCYFLGTCFLTSFKSIRLNIAGLHGYTFEKERLFSINGYIKIPFTETSLITKKLTTLKNRRLSDGKKREKSTHNVAIRRSEGTQWSTLYNLNLLMVWIINTFTRTHLTGSRLSKWKVALKHSSSSGSLNQYFHIEIKRQQRHLQNFWAGIRTIMPTFKSLFTYSLF